MHYGTNSIVYIFVLSLSLVILCYAGYAYYKKRFQKVKKVESKAVARRQAAIARQNVPGVVVDRDQAVRDRLRARMRTNRRPQAAVAALESSGSDQSDQELPIARPATAATDETTQGDEPTEKKKIGVKKQRKLDEKKLRKEEREALEREREEKKKLDAQLEKEKKEKEAEENRLEALRLEQLRLQREEEERREAEEYARMKAEFSIEEEGAEAITQDEQFTQQFLSHIIQAKVTMVEELASAFQIKTKDCIDLLNEHLSSGRLSGVLDDRGKFIYISQSEYESVAKFIRQRGRVTIRELAENSNRLIQLSQPIPVAHVSS